VLGFKVLGSGYSRSGLRLASSREPNCKVQTEVREMHGPIRIVLPATRAMRELLLVLYDSIDGLQSGTGRRQPPDPSYKGTVFSSPCTCTLGFAATSHCEKIRKKVSTLARTGQSVSGRGVSGRAVPPGRRYRLGRLLASLERVQMDVVDCGIRDTVECEE